MRKMTLLCCWYLTRYHWATVYVDSGIPHLPPLIVRPGSQPSANIDKARQPAQHRLMV